MPVFGHQKRILNAHMLFMCTVPMGLDSRHRQRSLELRTTSDPRQPLQLNFQLTNTGSCHDHQWYQQQHYTDFILHFLDRLDLRYTFPTIHYFAELGKVPGS